MLNSDASYRLWFEDDGRAARREALQVRPARPPVDRPRRSIFGRRTV